MRVATGLPALAAAVVTGDRTVARAAVGVRRAGGDVPVTIADRFHLGSDTKAMTAALLGVLVDEGRVAWTTTLAAVWPELAPGMRAEYREVTLRVTGRPYEELMAARIFAPLGIRSAGWGAAGTPGLGPGHEDQPWPHRIAADGQRVAVAPSPTADNPPVMAPAGRAHMTIDDWATWCRAVLRAASGRLSLWRPATAGVLTTPATPVTGGVRYGSGWSGMTRVWAGPTGRVLTHAGSNTMNHAVAWLAPDADFGVLVVTNQGGVVAQAATDAVVGRVIAWRRAGAPGSRTMPAR